MLQSVCCGVAPIVNALAILSPSNANPFSSALALSTPGALALGAFLLSFAPPSVGPALLPVYSASVTPLVTSLVVLSSFLTLLGSICLCFLGVLSAPVVSQSIVLSLL